MSSKSHPPLADEQLQRLRAALADRYPIERELGSGGMATVYLAEDVKQKRNAGRRGPTERLRRRKKKSPFLDYAMSNVQRSYEEELE